MQNDYPKAKQLPGCLPSQFRHAIETHDAAIAGSGVEIWIGAEPTFTLRSSEAPEWLSQALGGDKQTYAWRMARELHSRHPGSVILRSVGRQYRGEECPRWSIGLLERRDGVPVWTGPADPIVAAPQTPIPGELQRVLDALENLFEARHWKCKRIQTQDTGEHRLLLRTDAGSIDEIPLSDPRFMRRSIHQQQTPDTGLSDSLADEGFYLFIMGETEVSTTSTSVWVELPAFKQVSDFLDCLSLLNEAAVAAGLTQLLIQGFPPPVDHSLSWTTITPDPAVLEINQAPQADMAHFVVANDELFVIAHDLGLSPYRLQYNGSVSDSGGGGQFTIGGRAPSSSPFFVVPRLLPRLIRYFILHPALSYLFAPEYVGSASQLPRADEGTRDGFHELELALEQIERQPEISAEFLWSSLAPFLADPSGNSHRSELNIEKLWNPTLPLRGCLGLLEFRAFRMPRTPERSAAVAMLLRGVTAMLAEQDLSPSLHDWGDELHDRYALPYFLRQDLHAVLLDLEGNGFGLDQSVQHELMVDPARAQWSANFAGCRITIEQAIEFWPLVGDVASQESGGSRLVDSSTLRLQISLRKLQANDEISLDNWHMQTRGFEIPLRSREDDLGQVRLIGLRFRDFLPWRGLHPAIKPWGPITLSLWHPEREEACELSLHSWRVDGLPYSGLPASLEDAAERQTQRLVIRTVRRIDLLPAEAPPPGAVTPFTLDLRRV